MRATLLLSTALICLPLLNAAAQSIEDSMIKAYGTNPTLTAERAQLRVTDENLPQAQALRRPTVSGQGDVGFAYEETNSDTLGNGSFEPRDVSVGVTQPIWTGGRADAAISQAEYQVRAERANLLNVEETVLLQAATAHLDVVRDQALLGLAINNVKVLTQNLNETKAQLAVGVATNTDLAQAQASLAQAIAGQQQAEANLTNSRAEYLQAVGEMPGTLTQPPVVANLPVSQDTAIKLATQNNPAVLTAQANEQAARAGIDVASANLMPSLGVSGQLLHQEDQQGPGGLRTDSAQVLLTLTVPLYQAGAEYSKVRQAKESYGETRNQIEVADRNATLDATQAWQSYQANLANTSSFETQVKANIIAYQGTVEEQRVGTRTTLDVLNAQQALYTAESNVTTAQHDAAVNAYQLKAAIGEMTALAMNLQVERYDPTQHYNQVRDKWIGTEPPSTP
jgi:TolC family type I secretion outer membrane protein